MYDYGISNLAQGFFQGRALAQQEQEAERQRQRQERADQRVEEEYQYTQGRRRIEDPLRTRALTAQVDGAELGLTKTRGELEEWQRNAPGRQAVADLATREATWGLENFDANKALERQTKDLQRMIQQQQLTNAQLSGRASQLQLDNAQRAADAEKYMQDFVSPLMAALQSGDEETMRTIAPQFNPRNLTYNQNTREYNVVVDIPTGEVGEDGKPIVKPMPIFGETPESIAAKVATIHNPQYGPKLMLSYYTNRAAQLGAQHQAEVARIEEQRKALYDALSKSPQFQMLPAEQQIEEMGKIDLKIAERLAEVGDSDDDGVPDSREPVRSGLSRYMQGDQGVRTAAPQAERVFAENDKGERVEFVNGEWVPVKDEEPEPAPPRQPAATAPPWQGWSGQPTSQAAPALLARPIAQQYPSPYGLSGVSFSG